MNEEEKFKRYISGYDLGDTMIRLKVRHTWKVVLAADQIAEKLGLNASERDLVHIAALFHDIGRFEQAARYHTFIDSQSIDHARLGASILEKGNFLDDLDPKTRLIVLNAVRDHSLFSLPEYSGPNSELQDIVSRIIRDADKIDIFRVIAEERTEDTTGASAEDIEGLTLTDSVADSLLNGKSILRSDRKNALDIWVSYLGFFGDLNYPVSWKIAEEQGYWKKPLEQMNFRDKATKSILKKVQLQIEKRMSEYSE